VVQELQLAATHRRDWQTCPDGAFEPCVTIVLSVPWPVEHAGLTLLAGGMDY
jgi:hypothetical protein